MLNNYQTIESARQFNGRRCQVVIDTVKVTTPANIKEHKFEVVRVKDVIAVVLVDLDTNKVVLNENTRYPVGERFLELIAGQIEVGQSPEDACRAEAEQEGGYVLEDIQKLGEFYTSPGLLTEKCTIFLAKGRRTGTKALEEMEDLENKQFTAAQVAMLLAENKIRDLKTAYGLNVFVLAGVVAAKGA